MTNPKQHAHNGLNDVNDVAPSSSAHQTEECVGAEVTEDHAFTRQPGENGGIAGFEQLIREMGLGRGVIEEIVQDAFARFTQDADDSHNGPADDDDADQFDLTMQRLDIPANLEEFYPEIYVGLKKCVSDIVTPENQQMVQRALKKVSALMDDGSVDGRGPVGLLIHFLRKWAAVPKRTNMVPSDSRN